MHNFGIPYRPRDKPVQEDWNTVAQKFGVDVRDLIFFNFLTNDHDEVNWYLHHHTGCKKVSPSGNNWMFSNTAQPGIIYIPPADDTKIDFDPQGMCVWMPDSIKHFMLRLSAISQGMTGYKGDRVKALVRVIVNSGYPAARELWYYNDLSISVYVDLNTGESKRREMTKNTNQVFPFDGDSGVYGQQGSEERRSGKWRIHPVQHLLDKFACGYADATALKRELENIDEEIYRGWHALDMLAAKTSQGGASAYGDTVWQFVDHVRFLINQDSNLYSAFRP